jgi:hypothetical protein
MLKSFLFLGRSVLFSTQWMVRADLRSLVLVQVPQMEAGRKLNANTTPTSGERASIRLPAASALLWEEPRSIISI